MLALLTALIATAQQPLPSDSAVRAILTQRVPALHGAGIVVGLFGPDDERRVVALGVPADRVFEIGSITHVFTAATLAAMTAGGAVRLDDPVAKYLPASVHIPSRNGRQITLLDLVTHTSGLPGPLPNLSPTDTIELDSLLSGFELPRDIGAAYEYSNVGMGLLGRALTVRDGRTFEDLVRKHVLWPLGMKETAIALVPDLRSRLAVGHDADGRAIPSRDFIAGAGALRSNAKDMLTFLMANVDSATTPIGRAIHQTHALGLAWHTLTRPGAGAGGSIVWYSGAAPGFRSYIGFVPTRGVGVIVLSNSSVDVDDIGFHLLDETIPSPLGPRP